MRKLPCAIVEDDLISLKVIQSMAEKTGVLQVEGAFTYPVEAAAWLASHPVDVLFLDIEMPDLPGFDLLKTLTQKPQVIIVSGKPKFAVDAFQFAVTDYLLKPVTDYSRFLMAVNKAMANLTTQAKSVGTEDDSLFVKVDSLLTKIRLDEILWVEAAGDYIKIQTADRNYMVYATLKKIEDRLDKEKFVRIHRSYIVNLHRISNIDATNLEINKKIFPISSSYRDELLSKINVL
jgi:DNA-binding LytR/AlgR family response regulator